MNIPDPAFELSNTERDSALWKKLTAYFEKELASARKKNDAVMDINATNMLRGDIRRIKKILSLNEARIVTDRDAGNRSE